MGLLKNLIIKQTEFIKTNLPTILNFVGCFGVVGTVVVTNKMTKKIEDKKADIYTSEDDTETKAKRVMKEVVPLYLPIVAVSMATMAGIIVADRMHLQRERTLSKGLLLSSAILSTYRDKIREEKGVEEEQKLYSDVISSLPKEVSTNELITFYDPQMHFWFETTWLNFMQGQYELNRNLIMCEGDIRVETFYNELPEVDYRNIPYRAKNYGWTYDMFLDIPDFWIHYGLRKVLAPTGDFYEITWLTRPINLETDCDESELEAPEETFYDTDNWEYGIPD